jgi:beta-lactamase regulating signal transducer with metallopeptidase domain
METLMWYLVKVNVIFSILFMAYFFLFKNEKAFYLNRAFLLSSLLLSLLLPLVPAMHVASGSAFPNYVTGINPLKNVLGTGPVFQKGAQTGTDPAAHGFSAGIFSHITVIQVLMGIYLLVALVLLNKFIYQLLNLYFLFKRSKRYKGDAIIYCEHNQQVLPFSFFNILFINPGSNYHQLELIIEHEKVHIGQWHSLDILLAEVFSIVTWINPLTVLLKRYNRLNLEYIADQEVLNTGIDKKQYQLSILQNSMNPNAYPLTNLFSSSKIKLRIKMINQSKPTRKLYKYLFVLPLVLISYLLVNPVIASTAGIKISAAGDMPLTAFEGIYQDHDAPTAYFKVTVVNSTLVANRLDFKQQYVLNRTSELAFESTDPESGKKLIITFSKNGAGAISQALVDDRTPWIKVNAYKPVDQVKLPPGMLTKFEGKYQFEAKPGTFLTISVNGNGLILKQLWDGKEIGPFVATGPRLDFLYMKDALPLRFVKDKSGNVVKMHASGGDVWDKVKE